MTVTSIRPVRTVRQTVHRYLIQETQAEYKSEYYQGEILPMAGGTPNHNRIGLNFVIAVDAALDDTPCEVFGSDVRLFIEQHAMFTYPDVMIVCGGLVYAAGRRDTIINPTVIVEVLSQSTREYDRTTKFSRYRALRSFRDYILIDPYRVYVEYFHQLDDGRWVLTMLDDVTDTLRLESIGIEISLKQLYRRVEWD